MTMEVLKFSDMDCGICHKMSNYDSRVATELGLGFVQVIIQDRPVYRKYRAVFCAQYPKVAGIHEGAGWPTYFVMSDDKLIGEIKGGMDKGEFRQRLKKILDDTR